jgi:hypothetical protein
MAPCALGRLGDKMSVYQSFSYNPTEMAEQLTSATHDTLSYLFKNKYLTKEQFDELSLRLMVVAMPNQKGFGRKLLEYFFGDKEEENIWVFPIVEVADHYAPTPSSKPKNVTKIKPKLEVVKDDNSN